MFKLENFKVLEYGQVLRQGNEKIILLVGGEPQAAILRNVLFVKDGLEKVEKSINKSHVEEFEKMYRWAWEARVENREIIKSLTIGF